MSGRYVLDTDNARGLPSQPFMSAPSHKECLDSPDTVPVTLEPKRGVIVNTLVRKKDRDRNQIWPWVGEEHHALSGGIHSGARLGWSDSTANFDARLQTFDAIDTVGRKLFRGCFPGGR